jgi:hypothetical protein
MSWWREQRQAWANDWRSVWSGLRQTPGRVARVLGFVTRIAVYGALIAALIIALFVAWGTWPSTNIFDTPIASLTLRQIVYAVGFLSIATLAATLGMALVTLLFSPSNDAEIRKSWAAYGVVLVILLIVCVIAYRALK